MKSFWFDCPECKGRFRFSIDFIPDGCALSTLCPLCKERIELTPAEIAPVPDKLSEEEMS